MREVGGREGSGEALLGDGGVGVVDGCVMIFVACL